MRDTDLMEEIYYFEAVVASMASVVGDVPSARRALWSCLDDEAQIRLYYARDGLSLEEWESRYGDFPPSRRVRGRHARTVEDDVMADIELGLI